MEVLRFEPLRAFVDVPFWSELGKRKLNELNLSEEPVKITGYLRCCQYQQQSSFVELEKTSFELTSKKGYYNVYGILYCLNSTENFENFNRDKATRHVIKDIRDLSSNENFEVLDASQLLKFILITYCNLKNHTYTYWFAFPVLKPPRPFVSSSQILSDTIDKNTLDKIVTSCSAFFEKDENLKNLPLFILSQNEIGSSKALMQINNISEIDKIEQGAYFVFLDPSHLPKYPSSILRNLLYTLSKRISNDRTIKVVCLREKAGCIDTNHSLLLQVQLQKISESSNVNSADDISFVAGWQCQSPGHEGPRHIDLSSHFDPRCLANEAADLNTRLMLWRSAPNLNIDKISQTSCLLLGMGTLGCSVARCLLGWGIKKLTLVDNSKVSFSNPVRQNLYVFEDCLEGGKPKATCAASHLKNILPNCQAQGLNLDIPMPGHPPLDASERKEMLISFEKLRELVSANDVVFLLMDTRESRWLPTLLGAAESKIVINAALGFDCYLVMRHGANTEPESGKRLGCYFCNDVFAPVNSTRNRAFDQQCTVTRTGVAPIASALAVEMLISILEHPLGNRAPFMLSSAADSTSVPHMIRGSLSDFSQISMVAHSFDQCTACSPKVIAEYKKQGYTFIEQAIMDSKYLEDLTGLSNLHKSIEDKSDDMVESVGNDLENWIEI